MKRLVSLVAGVALVFLSATTAAAANPHFVGTPVLTEAADGALNVTGSVAGLGNEDITVTLEGTGIAQVECENPGGNVAPGQDTEVDVSGSQSDIRVKNGRAYFDVTTSEPGPLNAAEVCPNRKWTANIVDVDFSSATLTVEQAGEVVLEENYTL